MKSGQMRFGVSQESTPTFGQVSLPAFDLEEFDSQLVLQTRDRIANRRLRAVESLRSSRETTQLDHSLQNLPFIEGGSHTCQYIELIDDQVGREIPLLGSGRSRRCTVLPPSPRF